ncbi:unnamed protein product [Ostreobium quekettii]|uniref:TATA-box binding protein n=1 Tax=Ostreobium quekettii TaxID=121088 RepID=A0A8S1J8V7_9CHLO|nr:unnamed protein product [Ostreobium quekettii]|eukprot:evm.model.scf_1046.3 EVM.evm.TU.scf_1046.3   scf_1046:29533-32707(+)
MDSLSPAAPSTSAPAPLPGNAGLTGGPSGPASGALVDLAKHPSGIVPVLQNVVSTCFMGRCLDLKQIAIHARNAEYNPKRFAAVIMRLREPKTTALIFAAGKMVCTGARSESDSKLAAKKFAKIIQKIGFPDVVFKDFKVQNIVASCDACFPVRLEGLQHKHSIFARYEPELFPGLIYRMRKPKVVLLIFVSGKLVLTGAKTREDIYQAFEMIYPALLEFRKGDAQQLGKSLPGHGPSGRPSQPTSAEGSDESGHNVLTPPSSTGPSSAQDNPQEPVNEDAMLGPMMSALTGLGLPEGSGLHLDDGENDGASDDNGVLES